MRIVLASLEEPFKGQFLESYYFYFFLVCEEFELATPCGSHSFCSESSGWAECSCEEGFEEDPSYSADRNGGAENATCSRIDPCRNYDCGNVINSFCVSVNDEPHCQCEASFTTMKKNDSSDFYYETEEIYFTEDCLNIFCQSDNPCAVSDCSTISFGQVNISKKKFLKNPFLNILVR